MGRPRVWRHSIVLLLTGALLAAASGAAQARAKPRCVVPNVKGDTLAAAKKRLTSAHCAAGTVKQPTGSGASIVASQSPKAGLKEKDGDRVELTMKLKPTVLSTTTTNPVTTTPVATIPALIATAPLATATSENGGAYYLVGASLYYGAAAGTALVSQPEPVTFSIIDGTTGQTLATFSGTTGSSSDCTIAATLNGNTVTFTGQPPLASYTGCALGSPVNVPVTDTPLLGVSFAGNSTYAASDTTLSSEAPI